MIKRVLMAVAVAIALTSPAFAFHCPKDMAEIDAALAKNPKLTSEQLAEVKKYRAEGEAYHKAGKHKEAVDSLAEAKEILGLK
jgi:hypothetical protein